MTDSEFDEFVTANLPHFVAVNYRRALDAASPGDRVAGIVRTYDFGLRALSLGLVSQYLIHDQTTIANPDINNLLEDRFPHLTLDAWQKLLFTILRAYEGNRDLFFMPELYDFYWDTSTVPHKPRPGVRDPFDRLTQIASDLQREELRPRDDAGWNALAARATGLMRQVFAGLSFLSRYEMIRVVNADETGYDFELHKGLNVTTGRGPRPAGADIAAGWFYMRRGPQAQGADPVLQLHPFLITWQDAALDAATPAPPGPVEDAAPAAAPSSGPTPDVAPSAVPPIGAHDIGVYDRYIYDYGKLQYLLTTLGKTVLNEAFVSEYMKIILDTIEQYKRDKQEAERLTWTQLQDLAHDITGVRMATVRNRKYASSRYVERAAAAAALDRFLKSDRRCFVLAGKSAVGKTNFLLALADALGERDDVCLLMYDGGQIRSDGSLTALISADFDNRLKLPERRIDNIWPEIAAINGIEEHQVLLVVDALNESPAARKLLGQVDDLVATPWPWLKIVVSSRPETWRTIKQGVKLTEDLYFRTDEGPATTEPFSYSVQLEPFTDAELAAAYTKYCTADAFNIATPFESLDPGVRELLRDPFNLWLVSSTYRGKPSAAGQIPASLETTQLIQDYFDAADILAREDRRFLQTQLVPLFAREGRYTNRLSIADIDAGGTAFYNAIFSEQELSDGTRMNQSFSDLVDAGIVMLTGQGERERLVFTYDRFYEYFIGNYLYEQAAAAPGDHAPRYAPVITALPDHVYLWGALVQALIRELRGGNMQIVASLAPDAERNRYLRSALVSALVRFGNDHKEDVHSFLFKLTGSTPAPARSFLAQAWGLKDRLQREAERATIEDLIGVDVAAQLGMTDLLAAAAADASEGLRSAAVLHTYYLWKRNHEPGYKVLDELSQRKASGPLQMPDLYAAESLLGLCAAILGQTRDADTSVRLLTLGRRTVRQLLLLGEEGPSLNLGGRIRLAAAGIIREQAVDRIVRYVVRLLSGWGSRAWASFDNMTHIFDLTPEQKAQVKRIVPLLDPDTPGVGDHMAEMVAVIEWGDAVCECIVEYSLLAHAKVDFAATLPAFRELIAAGLKTQPPRCWAYGPNMSLIWSALRQAKPDPAIDEVTRQIVQAIQADPAKWLAAAKAARPRPIPTDGASTPIGQLAWAGHVLAGRGDSPPLYDYLEKAKARRDTEYLLHYVNSEAPVMIDFGWYPAALDSLLPLADYDDAQVREALIQALVRIQRQAPDTVEEWLIGHELPQEIVQQVLAYPPTERANDLMTYQLLWLMFDWFLWGPKALREAMAYYVNAALTMPNIEEWMKFITRDLLNLIAGDLLLAVPEDAPSRKILAAYPSFAPESIQGHPA
jgi:hypothetical protein